MANKKIKNINVFLRIFSIQGGIWLPKGGVIMYE
jgi:hypothetical protein